MPNSSRPILLIGASALLAAAIVVPIAGPAEAAPVTSAAVAVRPAPVADAGAELTAPSVRLVAGDRTITVAWTRVTGAQSYTVRYGTKKSLAGARSVSTKSVGVTLGKLSNSHSYYVRVTALGDGSVQSGVGSASSATTSARPAAGYPRAVSDVHARPGTAPGSVVVTWSGGSRDTKVGVMAGGESTTKTDHFRTKWYPATSRSVTVTVPTRLEHVLGAGTGNLVFVRVVESNSTSAKPVMHLKYDIAQTYRISKLAAYSIAGPATRPSAGASLRVGELNTQSLAASRHFTKRDQWAQRAPRVAKTVEASHPDLFLTSELETTKLKSSCSNHPSKGVYCATQYTTLEKDLAAGSTKYKMATADAYPHVVAEIAAHPSWTGDITDGAQIFYNPATLTLLHHGYISPVFTLHVTGWTLASKVQDRWLSWAQFRMKSTGQEFLAVAVHFTAGNSKKLIAIRANEATRAAAYVKKLAAGEPVVLGGDFNSDPIRNANPDSRKFMEAGFIDAAATTHRSGDTYATFNGENGTGGPDPAYPTSIAPHRYPTSRIDYILLKNGAEPDTYANVLHKKGHTVERSYQGTDHNLQLATVKIG